MLGLREPCVAIFLGRGDDGTALVLCESALFWVGFEQCDNWLVEQHRTHKLASTRATVKEALGEEGKHCVGDVDVLKVTQLRAAERIDVEEDFECGDHLAQSGLDDTHLILPLRPVMRQKDVERAYLPRRAVRLGQQPLWPL